MAQKKITDLQLIDDVTDTLNIPGDDTLQTYRFTALQLITYIESKLHLPTTGDAFLTLKATAPSGWLLMNDGTIGSAASAATSRANADTQDLYELIWNNVSDTYAAVSSGRGANAEADFNANKTIALTKVLGRAIAISGAGSGLTSRVLGLTTGNETHVLDVSEMPSHTHTQSSHTHTINAHNTIGSETTPGSNFISRGNNSTNFRTSSDTTLDSGSVNSATPAIGSNGGGGAHNNMQPSSFWNVMIKL